MTYIVIISFTPMFWCIFSVELGTPILRRYCSEFNNCMPTFQRTILASICTPTPAQHRWRASFMHANDHWDRCGYSTPWVSMKQTFECSQRSCLHGVIWKGIPGTSFQNYIGGGQADYFFYPTSPPPNFCIPFLMHFIFEILVFF